MEWYEDECLKQQLNDDYLKGAFKDYYDTNVEEYNSVVGSLLDSYKIWLKDISIRSFDCFDSLEELMFDAFCYDDDFYYDEREGEYLPMLIITAQRETLNKIISNGLRVQKKYLVEISKHFLFTLNGKPVVRKYARKYKKKTFFRNLPNGVFPYMMKKFDVVKIWDQYHLWWVKLNLNCVKCKDECYNWRIILYLGDIINYKTY